MSTMIKLDLSPGVSAELDNCLTNMAGSPIGDPAREKGKAALAAIKTKGKRGASTLVTGDREVAKTVLDELQWIGWQCDGYDFGQQGMIAAARRAHTKLAALFKTLALLLMLVLASCVGTSGPSEPDATLATPDAQLDAGTVPRCADVGCPDVAFCNVDGCCSCNATGAPVQCLAATAAPDACEVTAVPDAVTVPRKLAIILGQSNGLGQGVASTVGLSAPYPAVPMMQHLDYALHDPIQWKDFSGDLRPRTGTGTPPDMGVELQLGRDLDAAEPGEWVVAKMAITETGLKKNWYPTANYPLSPAGGPNLYHQLVTWIAQVETATNSELVVVIWMQGEKDAKNLANATQYDINLETFEGDLSADTGRDFALVLNELSSQTTLEFRDEERAAQERFAAQCSRCALVNTDDLALKTDHLHYTSPSLVTMADRFSSPILQLVP